MSPSARPDPLYLIADALPTAIVLHRGGSIVYANPAMTRLCGYAADELARKDLAELFPERDAIRAPGLPSPDGTPPACRETPLQTRSGEARWIELSTAHVDIDGLRTQLCSLTDITERRRAEDGLRRLHARLETTIAQRTLDLQQAKASLEADIARRETAETELLTRYRELTELNLRLHDTQQQLIQAEKMASIGQLAAGVAHEINNPIAYVTSNIRSLKGYMADLLRVLDACVAQADALPPADRSAIDALKRSVDFDFLREDIVQLIGESEAGTERVRKIVQDLRDFSRSDSGEDWQTADLHVGLDSTLNIASNEIKYKADVVREYGDIPLVECLPSQLNQVFMNLFVNAAQAMPAERRGTIRVRTGARDDEVWIEIEDDAGGIPPEIVDRIFDPFFTTKPVGKGTGLGLPLSQGIVHRHGGRLTLNNRPGTGCTFRVVLPILHQPSGASP